MKISRRELLGAAAFSGLALASGPSGMPTRVLGRTGARVSVLAMGGGSRFLAYGTEDKALEAVTRPIDWGISYLDPAFAYGTALSETRVGKVMATRRKEVFLATKCPERNGDAAMRIIEGS